MRVAATAAIRSLNEPDGLADSHFTLTRGSPSRADVFPCKATRGVPPSPRVTAREGSLIGRRSAKRKTPRPTGPLARARAGYLTTSWPRQVADCTAISLPSVCFPHRWHSSQGFNAGTSARTTEAVFGGREGTPPACPLR